MNELLVVVVKYLEKEKETIKEKLLQLEEKYEVLEAEYRKNLEARFDCLEYLAAYKNSPQAL
jgi:septum formation topological specificity factor MinE